MKKIKGFINSAKKKGLSSVIVMLLLMVLVIISVGIMWAFLGNVITTQTEGIDLAGIQVDVDVEEVACEDGNLTVIVRRLPGQGSLKGLKFGIDNGTQVNIVEIEEERLDENGFKKYNLKEECIVREITVTPIVKTKSGGTRTGLNTDDYTPGPSSGLLPGSEPCGGACTGNQVCHENVCKDPVVFLKDKYSDSLVSWWRMNGDASDEMGRNDGTINGADCSVAGVFGNGCEFSSLDSVAIPHNETLNTYELTVLTWVNNTGQTNFNLMSKNAEVKHPLGSFWWYLEASNNRTTALFSDDPDLSFNVGLPQIWRDEWHFIGAILDRDSNTSYQYSGGSFTSGSDISSIPPLINTIPLVFGGNFGNGINAFLDEAMIFNRSLTLEEIQEIEGLDLS